MPADFRATATPDTFLTVHRSIPIRSPQPERPEIRGFLIHDDDGRQKARQRDGEQLPHLSGTVNTRRLIQFFVNRRQGGEVNDGIPSYGLPDAADDVYREEQFRIIEHRRLLHPQRGKYLRDGSVSIGQLHNDATNNHNGDEMWQICDGLDHF